MYQHPELRQSKVATHVEGILNPDSTRVVLMTQPQAENR